jgi:hypothetical protein
MGGSGSGRRCYSKATTSNYHQLDVRDWHRHGWLGRPFFFCHWWKVELAASTRSAPDVVRLYHRNDQARQSIPDRVRLEWTPCNYGGSRPWFLCPGCGRRVAILYGAGSFACRHCRQLAYDSQNDSGWRRSINQARVARMKLGASANLTEPLPERPKGMHRRTYRRLYGRAVGREQAFLAGTLSTFASFEQKISLVL